MIASGAIKAGDTVRLRSGQTVAVVIVYESHFKIVRLDVVDERGKAMRVPASEVIIQK